MDKFSIAQLSQYSGIKPHTIRIWEKRYNALQPSRTEGNTRFYGGKQLMRLLNITSLVQSGYKVSMVGGLSDKQLSELALQEMIIEKKKSTEEEVPIIELVKAAILFNQRKFENILDQCIADMGLKKTYLKIIYPFLDRLGLLWQTSLLAPAHEHFASNLIRQKLIAGVESLPVAHLGKPRWVLFLSEEEFHELGLLMAQFILKSNHQEVIYLGANLPLETLKVAVKSIDPDYLFMFFTITQESGNISQYYQRIEKFYKGNICIAASQMQLKEVQTGKKIKLIDTVETLENLIKKPIFK